VAHDNRGDRGDSNRGEFVDKTVQIKRCAAVVKGGRRFSFAAMVVVGDGKGRVGWGYGKANEVPPAVEKGQKQATRSLVSVPLVNDTIPHAVRAKFGSADVLLMPAGGGTGIIAGAAVRSVCEAAGIKNIITKSLGTSNQITVVKAAIKALKQLRTTQDTERLRGVTLS
jgi:small subunit ribosomal protein S5